ncbi:putative G-protein coupled receptor 83-like protein [Leptotrombidium deliense]|uniref:Putative G-protein coupled receptor 83-like protein n=1 Tax=Leptotrombidium deliense TaxID=299467 RepID=A0A443S803_9ACAR|nr:putative G-protein coupled receptor 83-like protein [Leptotrombidium deliense]
MLVIVLVVFTVCWLPVHIHHLYDFFVKPKYSSLEGYCNNSTSYFILYWLSISSCCYNPIIYYIFDPRFRTAFQTLFREATLKVTTKFYSTDATETNTRSENNKVNETSETTI